MNKKELDKIISLKQKAIQKTQDIISQKTKRQNGSRNTEKAISVFQEWLKHGGPDKYSLQIARDIKQVLVDVPEKTIYTYIWRWHSGNSPFPVIPENKKTQTQTKKKAKMVNK